MRFLGRVTNAHVPSQPVSGLVYITSSDFNTERYCDAAINATTGDYSCDAFLRSVDPLSVTYRVNDTWGTEDFTGSVTAIGAVGEMSLVQRSFAVSPTTMHLIGTVTDPYGRRLPGVQLSVSGAGIAYVGNGGDRTIALTTDARGTVEVQTGQIRTTNPLDHTAGSLILTGGTIAAAGGLTL